MFRRHKSSPTVSSGGDAMSTRTGGSHHSSNSSASTRVAINTSRATVAPAALELTAVHEFLGQQQIDVFDDSFVQRALDTSWESCRGGYECASRSDSEEDDFSTSLSSHPPPPRLRKVDTTTTTATPTTSSHRTDKSSSTSPRPTPPRYQPSVSPRSVLENIELRARRRREIMQHTLSPGSRADGDLTAVPATITHRPSSPSVLSGMTSPSALLLPPGSTREEEEESPNNNKEQPQAAAATISNKNVPHAVAAGNSDKPSKNRLRPPSPLSATSSMASSRTKPTWKSTRKSKSPPSDATTAVHSNVATVFWQDRITERTQRYGTHSYQTVLAWMDLGHAQFRQGEYKAAAGTFATAVRLTQARGGLPAAQALHFQGTATSRAETADKPAQAQALSLLERALQIRQAQLGADHPDTVATQNSMAWVYYYSQQHRQASETFWYVFWKRQALFGPRHPAVAVAATDLARTFRKLNRDSDAQNFYSIALQIYDQMHVPSSNPAVQRVRQELNALELAQQAV